MRGKWNRVGETFVIGVPLLAILFMLVTMIASRFW